MTGALSERNFNGWSHTFSSAITYQPSDAVSVSMGPQVLRSQSQAQYLATVVDPLQTETYGSRYVFGDLAQTEVSMPTRVNVTLSPRLGLQVYMQPLVSVGDYGAITEFARPRTYTTSSSTARDMGTIAPVPGTSLLEIDPDAGRARAELPDLAAGLQHQVAARERGGPMGVSARLDALSRLDAVWQRPVESGRLPVRARRVGPLGRRAG